MNYLILALSLSSCGMFVMGENSISCGHDNVNNPIDEKDISPSGTFVDALWRNFGVEEIPFYHAIDKRYQTWILSILASCVIGLTGVVPLLFIPFESGMKLTQGLDKSKYLRLLLSFAVGGLLGDVFLHLLPEAWHHAQHFGSEPHSNHRILGLWVLLGIFSFVVLEIMFTVSDKDASSCKSIETVINEKSKTGQNCIASIANGNSTSKDILKSSLDYNKVETNGCHKSNSQDFNTVAKAAGNNPPGVNILGYLNLLANGIDNFTHGLAVAASFLVGVKMGVLTTFAILIHEIPHEIGDFAILLKSGFQPWDAAKAQLSTATIGILGAIVALSTESTDEVGVCISWILPFTSGGFLNIALINVLPDLLRENDPWESLKQMVCLCSGICVMASISILFR